MELLTQSAEETKRFGSKMAADITSSKKAKTFALSGELGSGKTTFVQGLAQGLGLKSRIISPTFILVRSYNMPALSSFLYFYHIDLYRLEDNIEGEVKSLGFEETVIDPSNIVAVEWAEKIKGIIPKEALWIKFESLGENTRRITYEL